jgi:hypothetical protein
MGDGGLNIPEGVRTRFGCGGEKLPPNRKTPQAVNNSDEFSFGNHNWNTFVAGIQPQFQQLKYRPSML